jgi:hypothetical protein
VTGPEQARQDLAEILSDGRLELAKAMAHMIKLGHSAGRVDRARRALEVDTIREGPPGTRQTFYWQLPDCCPTCLRPYRPDATPTSASWGGNGAIIGDYWREERVATEPPRSPPEIATGTHLHCRHSRTTDPRDATSVGGRQLWNQVARAPIHGPTVNAA